MLIIQWFSSGYTSRSSHLCKSTSAFPTHNSHECKLSPEIEAIHFYFEKLMCLRGKKITSTALFLFLKIHAKVITSTQTLYTPSPIFFLPFFFSFSFSSTAASSSFSFFWLILIDWFFYWYFFYWYLLLICANLLYTRLLLSVALRFLRSKPISQIWISIRV